MRERVGQVRTLSAIVLQLSDGVSLSPWTLGDLAAFAIDVLPPVAARIVERVVGMLYVRGDDAGMRVLDRDQPNGVNCGEGRPAMRSLSRAVHDPASTGHGAWLFAAAAGQASRRCRSSGAHAPPAPFPDASMVSIDRLPSLRHWRICQQ